MKSLLITFGCSWTYGVGVNYTNDISVTEYNKIAWDQKICDQFSFRGLLSKRYNLINENFSSGGSSNQRQFRLAKEFFSLREIKQLKNEFDKILVLWGITSTARNEMWSLESGKLVNFFYSRRDNLKLNKHLLKFHYDHDHEVRSLRTEMHHWNTFFKSLNINNLWFDTFNHHNYNLPGPEILEFENLYKTAQGSDWPQWEDFLKNQFVVNQEIYDEITDGKRWAWAKLIRPIENLLFDRENPRDLLSKLALQNGCHTVDDRYHRSTRNIDSNRIEYLKNCKILNPISHHPTRLGHEQIADMLSPYIEKFL